MSTRLDIPQKCQRCHRLEPTTHFVLADETILICNQCHALLTLEDDLDRQYIEAARLQCDGKYDEALQWLDAYFQANQHRDQEQWLARAVASSRASILLQAARYADESRFGEVEQACNAWEAIGFDNVGQRYAHASIKAEAIAEEGRREDARAILEAALQYRDPAELPAVRFLLAQLAELAEQLGEPVKEQWRPLAKAVARRFRVELPEAETLGLSILKLRDITQELVPKRPDEWKNDPDEEPAAPPTDTPPAPSPQSTRQ